MSFVNIAEILSEIAMEDIVYQEYNMDVETRSIWRIAPELPFRQGPRPPFVVVEAGKFYAGKNYYTVRRDKNDKLLLFTISGTGRVYTENKQYLLKAGEGTMIDCRKYHRYETAGKEVWQFYWVHFQGDENNFYQNLIFPNSNQWIFSEKTAKALENLLEQIHFTDSLALCRRSHILENLLFTASLSRPEAHMDSSVYSAVDAAVNYMQTHYAENLILDQLADLVHLSKYHFLRMFKEMMQITPHRYLLMLRVNEAKKLLRTTNENLTSICAQTGFADEGHFCRTFKHITGQTPFQYRKTM